MKPDGFGILQEFFKNSADVFFYVKIPTGKKWRAKSAICGLYYISQYLWYFSSFLVGFYFSEKQKAAVEFTIMIVKLISCFHNSTLQEFSNISDLIYTWLCLIIVKKTAIIQDVAVAEEAVVNLRIVGGRHWLKETELFLLRLVSFTQFKDPK